MDTDKVIGIAGAGTMGAALARRFLTRDYQVHVYNRTPEKVRPLQESGARPATGPEQLLERVPVVLNLLRDGGATRQVLLAAGLDWQGRLLIQMATIAIEESRSLAQEITDRGGQYLEAPVLGSVPQVMSGELMIMVGGRRCLFDAQQPLLQVLTERDCVYVGPVGSAAAMKLAFNQLIASLTTAFAASHAFLKKEALPMDLFMDLLRKSALYAPTFDKKLTMMEARHFDPTNFSLENMHKDIRLIESAFQSRGISNLVLQAVRTIVERSMEKRMGDADYSALYEGLFDV